MKKQILQQLAKIKKVAEQTGMKGILTLSFSFDGLQHYNTVIASIKEYERIRHNIQVTPALVVQIIWE